MVKGYMFIAISNKEIAEMVLNEGNAILETMKGYCEEETPQSAKTLEIIQEENSEHTIGTTSSKPINVTSKAISERSF